MHSVFKNAPPEHAGLRSTGRAQALRERVLLHALEREKWHAPEIARELGLHEDEVSEALRYMLLHPPTVP